MTEITNTQQCFVQLWLRLERTRRLLSAQYRRFCIRNILKMWMGSNATDDLIWEVCRQASLMLCKDDDDDGNICQEPLCGWDELPPPMRRPRKHREWLRALIAVSLDIGMRKVDLKALDAAYSQAFPMSTPINVNKKRRERELKGS